MNYYLGAYIKARKPKGVSNFEYDINACHNNKCTNFQIEIINEKIKFCSSCGSNIKHQLLIRREIIKSIDENMLDQMLEEGRITESGEGYDCPKYRYFISNVFVNRENSCELELEDSAAIELNIKNIQSCIDNFNVLHKKDIEKLNILFDKIEVKFGLLDY